MHASVHPSTKASKLLNNLCFLARSGAMRKASLLKSTYINELRQIGERTGTPASVACRKTAASDLRTLITGSIS